jgi:hypothetical protein
MNPIISSNLTFLISLLCGQSLTGIGAKVWNEVDNKEEEASGDIAWQPLSEE